MTALQIKPCDYQQAKQACEDWHYSHSYPVAVDSRFGVWEGGEFIGCVLYGYGVSRNIGQAFGISQHFVRELMRVALTDHVAPVTQIVAATLKQIRRKQPHLRAIVSYADPEQGHVGTIYHAGGWIYLGTNSGGYAIHANGETIHPRMAYNKYGTSSVPRIQAQFDPDAYRIITQPKHKFVMPLDTQMRRRILRSKSQRRDASHTGDESHVRSVGTALDDVVSLGVAA